VHHSPFERPQIQLPKEATNLRLSKIQRNNFEAEALTIQYYEGSAVREPRDDLSRGAGGDGLEHVVELVWEMLY
jgi:hypothetical protein